MQLVEKTVDPKVKAFHEQVLTVMKMHSDMNYSIHIAVLSQIIGQLLVASGMDQETALDVMQKNLQVGIKNGIADAS